MTRPLGCLSGAGLLAGVLAAVIIAVVGAAGSNAMFSPGDLNATPGQAQVGGISTHSDLSHQCDQCHAAFWDGDRMGDRCLACHQEVAAELAVVSGFHSGFAEPGNCRDCHTEHGGPEAALTLAEISNYPHDRTGFSLRAHAPMAVGGAFRCMDCHPSQLREFSPVSCLGCHDELESGYTQKHLADFGRECLGCHDGVDHYGAAFDHQTLAFRLLGGHQGLGCSACHRGALTVLALQTTPTRCLACHAKDDVHAGRLGQECDTCHTPQTWTDATLEHQLTGFQLEGSHATADCLGCHVDRRWSGIPTDCLGCHKGQDPHAGQFAADCDACHAPTQWSEIHFDHQTSSYPLAGAHLQAACDSCHARGRYVGTPTSCLSCHASDDEHNGQFGQDCSSCHRPTRWSEVTFDHNRSAFPLVGAHLDIACDSCHAGGRYVGTPTSCVNCHASDDKHNGQFGRDCSACHRATRWSDVTFDHNRSGFPLTGAHRSVGCANCHAGGSFSGMPTACSACHSEPQIHQGVFGQDCAACHSTSAWLPASWNGPHTFPMNHGDAGGQCSTCHPSGYSEYTCYGCHKHDPAEIEKKHQEKGIPDFSDCTSCHATGKEDGGGGGNNGGGD